MLVFLVFIRNTPTPAPSYIQKEILLGVGMCIGMGLV